MTFIELMKHLGVTVKEAHEHHHVTAGWIGIDCPFCSPKWGHYRLGYNIRYGYMSCWSCGGHSLTSVVMELGNLSYPEAKALTGDLERIRVPEEFKKVGKLVLPDNLGKLLPAHLRYLKHRKFNPFKLVKMWDIKGIGIAQKLAWRIFIPIYYKGEIVSWTTRAITEEVAARYYAAPRECEKISSHDILYGEDHARNSIIVTEGPFDVWAIGPGAVCTCGLSYSRAQLNRIAKYPIRAICFDREREAQKRAEKLVNQLSVLSGETYLVKIESGKDAATADPKEIEEIRKQILAV